MKYVIKEEKKKHLTLHGVHLIYHLESNSIDVRETFKRAKIVQCQKWICNG